MLTSGIACMAAPTGAATGNTLAPTVVNATADSTTVPMAQRTNIKVEVVKNGHAGAFVNLPHEEISGAEIREITVDSANLGNNRIQLTYNFLIQPFEPGVVNVPEFKYVVEGDTFRSAPLSIKVLEPEMPKEMRDSLLLNANEGTKSVPGRWYDFIPSWWYWVVLAILFVALVALVVMLYRKNGPTLLPRKKVIPPHILAFRQLEELKQKKLSETGHEKEYYTILTDILRQYLEGRFRIYAREMSTTQIMDAVKTNDEINKYGESLWPVLETADFVKFAKVKPLIDENIRSFSTIKEFVQDTKPVEVPEEEQKGAKKGKKKVAKNKKAKK